MGIKSLFGFGQARDKPSNKAADAGYSFLFGRTTSGKPVNETTAMQTTAVYACVRILSEAIALLPVHVYQYKDGGGKEMVIDHPLYQVLHDEPNPEMTSFVFRETLMSHLLIWGNAYAQIIRDGAGRVLGLYPLLPNKMDVQRDEKYIDQGHHQRRKNPHCAGGAEPVRRGMRFLQRLRQSGRRIGGRFLRTVHQWRKGIAGTKRGV